MAVRLTISEQAITFIKENKKLLIDKFCSLKEYPSSGNPFTMFMAGSPGAGKTEFSKSIIPELQKRDPNSRIVRIDADEIRSLIPQFNGHNSKEVQAAASVGVEKIFDFVQHHLQNCILDGTFQNYDKARNNIERSLSKGRKVGVFYVYQDPFVAWDFTKKREKLEGRDVPKAAFVKAFFEAKENVLKIKSEFSEQIELVVIIQDPDNKLKEVTDTIDEALHKEYTESRLLKDLED